jgi:Adenosine-deaminase (editase) domain
MREVRCRGASVCCAAVDELLSSAELMACGMRASSSSSLSYSDCIAVASVCAGERVGDTCTRVKCDPTQVGGTFSDPRVHTTVCLSVCHTHTHTHTDTDTHTNKQTPQHTQIARHRVGMAADGSALADRVATTCLNTFRIQVSRKGKVSGREYTILAGSSPSRSLAFRFPAPLFAASQSAPMPLSHFVRAIGMITGYVLHHVRTDEMWTATLATGLKCLPANKIRSSGDAVNDCHAEVLATRALRRYAKRTSHTTDHMRSVIAMPIHFLTTKHPQTPDTHTHTYAHPHAHTHTKDTDTHTHKTHTHTHIHTGTDTHTDKTTDTCIHAHPGQSLEHVSLVVYQANRLCLNTAQDLLSAAEMLSVTQRETDSETPEASPQNRLTIAERFALLKAGFAAERLQSQRPILEFAPSHSRFRLRSGLRLYFYASQTPCT